ncbi:sex peptide receptor-like [Mizuhopecten yessoensis]|uniref:FMRFamide receptor n=1 Tax=Mizuhopecten yessoensis TaxID=6573 RepID=A0A210R385_MIZYE|nr:sex peptide receptor-like [Mizuhopecten yessoensis]OWF55404.1 FMRFamide receptor [Mizuhopecten yessoensis]
MAEEIQMDNNSFENVTTDAPFLLDLTVSFPIRYAVPLLGYFSPVLILITLVTNTLVVIVLLKKHMRSPTNAILAGMALSDMFTGLFPLPVFLYFFGLGNYKEYIPYKWCYTYKYMSELIPTIFHTASIWLTMALAIQRYIYICHSFKARKWCTITNVLYGTLAIYVIAILSQISRFFDSTYQPFIVPSRLDPNQTIVACEEALMPWVRDNPDVYYNVYYWFRVICIHLIPCTFLVVLNALLISAMRSAQLRRMQLLKQNKKSESKKLKDSNCTTLMLVAVVGLFLLVELPLGIIIIVNIMDNTFELGIFSDAEKYGIMNLISNFFILLSYPLNFFIYCGMSRQFRETFKRMFTGAPMPIDRDCSQYMTLPTENGKTALTTDETAL